MALVKVRQVAGPFLVAVLFFATVQSSEAAAREIPRVERAYTLAVWEEVQGVLERLFGTPRMKSGSSLDPDGRPHSAGGSTTADSGSSLDPDGKK